MIQNPTPLDLSESECTFTESQLLSGDLERLQTAPQRERDYLRVTSEKEIDAMRRSGYL